MLEIHDWLAIWQRNFTKADKTLEDWARSGSCCDIFTGENLFGETVVEGRIKTMAEGSKTCKGGTLGRFLDTGRRC
jgi:hypothetical protein